MKCIIKLSISIFTFIYVTTSFAADLVSNNEWNGYYFGGNIGGSWANVSVNVKTINSYINTVVLSPAGQTYAPAAAVSATGSFPESSGGVLGGLQLGYHRTIHTKFVAGVEADIQALDSKNMSNFQKVAPRIGDEPNTVTTNLSTSQSTKYLGTLQGKLGIIIPKFNYWLAYVTGGLAYGEVQSSTQFVGGQTPNTGSTDFNGYGNTSKIRSGYVVGGGIEKFVASRLSVKAEYLFYDLGTVYYSNGEQTTYRSGTTIVNFMNKSSSSIHFNGNIVRVGLNFHFS